MLQFKARVSLFIESKLKEKLCKHKTDDTEIDGVGFVIPDPMTQDFDPSAKVTEGDVVWERKLDKMWKLPVIWSVAPELMTHLEDEDTRHVELPDSAIAVIEESIDFNDALYLENCAYSATDIETVFSKDGGTIEWSVTIFSKNRKNPIANQRIVAQPK